jgi:hypothetical protein
MALINDLLIELKTAETLEQARVDGGSDLIDIKAGVSTLSDATLAALIEKLAHETEQLELIRVSIEALTNLVDHQYPIRRVFDIDPAVSEELAFKQRQMLDFANELRPIVIGADSGIISVV